MSPADLIDGPLWYLSATVFALGTLWRLFVILRVGLRPDLSRPRASAVLGALRGLVSRFLPKRVLWSRLRFQVVAGYLFHLGLFALLLFAAPHVAFLDDRLLGLAWTPMPHWAFVLSAELAFLGLLLLWLRRVLDPVARLLSTAGDHAASILTFLVMLSGCLALARDHESLRLLHLLLVELWLLYFPFSSLMHTFTFVIGRSALGARYGRRGVPV